MREIPLTRGKVALIDDADFDAVSQYKWNACHDRTGHWYASRQSSRKDGPQKQIFMHRYITGCPSGLEVDHRNHDGLDNRRENLRVCTRAQNQANNRRRGNPLLLKGIFRHRNGKWGANILVNGYRRKFGRFTTPEEAARAFDREAYAVWGEFAYLNFPNELQKGGDSIDAPTPEAQLTLEAV